MLHLWRNIDARLRSPRFTAELRAKRRAFEDGRPPDAGQEGVVVKALAALAATLECEAPFSRKSTASIMLLHILKFSASECIFQTEQ